MRALTVIFCFNIFQTENHANPKQKKTFETSNCKTARASAPVCERDSSSFDALTLRSGFARFSGARQTRGRLILPHWAIARNVQVDRSLHLNLDPVARSRSRNDLRNAIRLKMKEVLFKISHEMQVEQEPNRDDRESLPFLEEGGRRGLV